MICKAFYNSIGKLNSDILSTSEKSKFNRYVFDNIFKPKIEYCNKNNLFIELNNKDKSIINTFAEKKAKAKTIEWKGVDDSKRIKREITGACIEYGLLKYYNKEKYFDNSIVKHSYLKAYPDLLPLGVICDIKGSSINNVPLVFKNIRHYTCDVGEFKGKPYKCANLIGVTDTNRIWLLGIASPTILETYIDDNLLIIAKNDTKSGFWGVEYLKNIPKEWEEFRQICLKESIK